MSSIDKITSTTMLGLNIGVLAGVSGRVMKSINKMFGGTTKRKRRKSKRR
jgi:hypothetical protein